MGSKNPDNKKNSGSKNGNTSRMNTGAKSGNTSRMNTGTKSGNTGRMNSGGKSGNTGKMLKFESVEYSNVEKVDFKKKSSLSEGLSFLKKIRLIAILAIVVLLICGAVFVVIGYKVKTVQVEGSTHYTADEIRDMVIVNRLCENSLYLKFYYKNRKVENIPFVEQMDIQIMDRNTVRIIVYEKAIAGYVTYLENKMYFDKDGIIVESSKETVIGAPEITGLDFDHVILHEPLPVEDPRIFKEILSLTQLLNKKELLADKIYFDNMNNITLYYGNVRVDLGDGEHLQEQITHLKAILEKANPMHLSGRLHMEDFSADNPRATFEVDDE